MEISFEIPGRLPVMTLPEVAFFPQALLPLFIFEERYQAMLQDVLESHRMFIVAGINPERLPLSLEKDPNHEVASVGIIRACRTHEDGTAHLLLHGLSRVRLVSTYEDKAYREADISPLHTLRGSFSESDVEKKRAQLKELITRKYEQIGNVPKEVLKHIDQVEDIEVYIDLVSYSLVSDPKLKQQLLSTLDLQERYEQLIRYLENELDEYED